MTATQLISLAMAFAALLISSADLGARAQAKGDRASVRRTLSLSMCALWRRQHELRYWSDKFAVSPEQLKEAVEKVGDRADKVEQLLKGK